MPVRGHCGYYDCGAICKPRNLLKTVPNLGRASLHAYLVTDWKPWGGDGALAALTDECQDAF